MQVWLSESNNDRPTCKDFCKGRKKKVDYTTFLTYFVRSVVGPEIFRNRLQENEDICPPDAVCTISDEAFALLLLENSYDRWLDIYTTCGGMPKQRRGDRSRRIDSEIEPKYTKGGIKYTDEDKASKTKGWTEEGITRYNKLFQSVKKDRQKLPGFMKKFKAEQKTTLDNTAKRKRASHVHAVHSMWEDEGTDTEEQEADQDVAVEEDSDSEENNDE